MATKLQEDGSRYPTTTPNAVTITDIEDPPLLRPRQRQLIILMRSPWLTSSDGRVSVFPILPVSSALLICASFCDPFYTVSLSFVRHILFGSNQFLVFD